MDIFIDGMRTMRIHFLFLFVIFCVSACSDGVDPNYKISYNLIKNENLKCPPPSIFYRHEYGNSGVFFVCEFSEGPFVAVNKGHVSVRGQHKAGRHIGLWESYDKDGNVVNSTYYLEND